MGNWKAEYLKAAKPKLFNFIITENYETISRCKPEGLTVCLLIYVAYMSVNQSNVNNLHICAVWPESILLANQLLNSHLIIPKNDTGQLQNGNVDYSI